MAKIRRPYGQNQGQDKMNDGLANYMDAADEFTRDGYKEMGDAQGYDWGNLSDSEMKRVTTKPRLEQFQIEALQDIADRKRDGLSLRDKANLQSIEDDANRANRGRQDAIMQEMQARGTMGSGMEAVLRSQAAQEANNRVSRSQQEVAARSEEAKQRASQQLGEMSTSYRSQEFNENAAKAQAQDRINQYNNAGRNQVSRDTWGENNARDRMNSQNYQQFQRDKMSANQGAADMLYNSGVEDQNRARLEQQEREKRKKARNGAVTGAIGGAVGGYFGGPAGASAGYSAGNALGQSFARGGRVYGPEIAPGDDEINDVVPAALSAGEIVLPKTVANDPAAAADFVANDPLNKIKSPEVREYLRAKAEARKKLDEANDMAKWGDYAGVAGDIATGLVNANKPKDVILHNRMNALGSAPKVIASEDQKIDFSGSKGLLDAQSKRAREAYDQVGTDFESNLKAGQVDKSLQGQDPTSEQSKRAQTLAKSILASKAKEAEAAGDKEGANAFRSMDVSKLSAAEAKEFYDGLKNSDYKDVLNNLAADKRLKAQIAAEDRRANKPSAAQAKLLGAARSAEASRALRQDTFKQIEDAYAGAMTGPVTGRVGQAINKVGFSAGEATDNLNVKTGKMLADYIKEISGATVPETEMRRLAALMPAASDSADLFKTKMKILREEVDNTVNRARIEAGMEPLKFEQAGASGSWDGNGSSGKKYDWED